ncbi:hypothetical protein HY988_06695 [Candidatus Micrarchaeota archaeon]|nr:hypothetical protein [Candidatus Micrarchaeota archaeon]
MAEEIENVLNQMKEKGIAGAVVRVDGTPLYSTLALSENAAGIIASLSEITNSIMKKMGDRQKSAEITFDNSILIVVPQKNYVFCGLIKNRDDKKIVLEYAEKANAYL